MKKIASIKLIKKCIAQGFTLVELMIALVLGLILSGAITKIYLQNNASARQDEQIARLQENGRFALKLLQREISMAGFAGGTPQQLGLVAQTLNTGCTNDTWTLDLTNPLDIVNNATPNSTWISEAGISIDCGVSIEVVEDTDVISIKRTADSPTVTNGSLIGNSSYIDKQWYFRLADNRSDKSWSFVAENSSFNTDDLTAGSDVDYWAYFHKIFYIREDNEIPTLCARVLDGNTMEEECYVEGIENIQVELGIDTNNDAIPDIFKSNADVTDMDDVVVARIYILARSPETVPGYTDSKTYYLGETKIENPNDGFFRRVYTSTIQIKNARLPNA